MLFLKLFHDWVHLACSRPFKKSFLVFIYCLSAVWSGFTSTQPVHCMWPGITHFSLSGSLSATYQVLILSHAPSISFHCFIPLSPSLCVSQGLCSVVLSSRKMRMALGWQWAAITLCLYSLWKRVRKTQIHVVHCSCFALHNMHMQNSFTSELNTHLSPLTIKAWIIIWLCNTTVLYNYDTNSAKYIVAFPVTTARQLKCVFKLLVIVLTLYCAATIAHWWYQMLP